MRARELVWILALTGCDQVFGLQDRDAPTDASTVDTTNAPLPHGLIRLYPMDALEGNRLADATGLGHHAVCPVGACPDQTIGMVGGALMFDGSRQFAQAASDADLETLEDFTVAMWTYIDHQTGASQCLVSKVLAGGGDSWQLCLDATGHWDFSTGAGELVVLPEPAALGQWHHLAIRWNGTTKMKTISIDAIDRGSQPGVIATDGGGLVLAGDLDLGQPHALLAGSLDDLRIYDRFLTGAELIELATRPPESLTRSR
jgi:hypothetical protein